LVGAHFPVEKQLDGFQFTRVKGITKSDLSSLWISYGWIIMVICCFSVQPGLEKPTSIHSHKTEGHTGRLYGIFKLVLPFASYLKMADIQRRAGVRVNRILRTDLIIINEIGYTLIERKGN